MTQATNLSIQDTRWNDAKLVGGVSAAHFVSHFYILLLPPLFAVVRDEYDVSYTELGYALVLFNVASAALQTPAGFLVDRVSARMMLIVALVLSAASFAIVGLVHSFWVLVAMFGVAGIANAIYHPADYALLSQHVSNPRVGQAFSIHTFAGILGGAAAPPSLLVMQSFWGWRGAFVGGGVVGLIVAAALLIPGDIESKPKTAMETRKAAVSAGTAAQDWRLLLSPPILLNLLFFTLLAVTSAGLQNYSVVALDALYGTPLTLANTALSIYLLLNAFGVLLGGMLLGWTHRHAIVATVGLVASGACAAIIGIVDPGTVGLIVLMAACGLFTGAIMPSRDMLVREVTPAGSFGKVFGFVTTGFNIGGMIAPLICGAVMDRGDPRAVFLLVGIGSLIAILTVLSRPSRSKPSDGFPA
jgi:MFS transporter, FSR family, fosmidomycin resistance protein